MAAFTSQEKRAVLVSLKSQSRPQEHSAARRIKSIENVSNLSRNQTRDLQPFSTVRQPSVRHPLPHTHWIF